MTPCPPEKHRAITFEALESRAHLSVGAATGLTRATALDAQSHPAAVTVSRGVKRSLAGPTSSTPSISISPATDFGNSVTGAISDGKLSIPYRFFIPHLTSTTQKVPLILYLHGLGDAGTDNVTQTFWMSNLQANTASGPYAAYVIAPQIPAPGVWAVEGKNPTEVEALTMALIRAVLPYNPHIDPTRIYVTGISAGSQGVWDLLQRNPGFFAAGVPMSAGINPNVAPRLKAEPIWAFHGGSDTEVPPSSTRAMIAAIIAAGGTPWYTEIGGAGHAIWDSVFAKQTLYAWLYSKHLAVKGK